MTNTAVASTENTSIAAVIDDVIARGDLSKLSAEQRVVHYHNVCRSLGLNHLTQPFQYVSLQGKLVLYARKDATDQLRKLNGINIAIVERVVNDGLLTVHVRATDKAGRVDEDFGVVSLGQLKGEAAANAMMKAVTKAKRRVTLSISGLGFADETEIDDITAAASAMLPDDMPTIERPTEVQRVEPFQLDHPEDHDHWREWAQTFIAFVRAAASLAEVDRWIELNSDTLKKMGEVEDKMARMLGNAIDQQRIARGATPASEPPA